MRTSARNPGLVEQLPSPVQSMELQQTLAAARSFVTSAGKSKRLNSVATVPGLSAQGGKRRIADMCLRIAHWRKRKKRPSRSYMGTVQRAVLRLFSMGELKLMRH